jgi:hypothetical protein
VVLALKVDFGSVTQLLMVVGADAIMLTAGVVAASYRCAAP